MSWLGFLKYISTDEIPEEQHKYNLVRNGLKDSKYASLVKTNMGLTQSSVSMEYVSKNLTWEGYPFPAYIIKFLYNSPNDYIDAYIVENIPNECLEQVSKICHDANVLSLEEEKRQKIDPNYCVGFVVEDGWIKARGPVSSFANPRPVQFDKEYVKQMISCVDRIINYYEHFLFPLLMKYIASNKNMYDEFFVFHTPY